MLTKNSYFWSIDAHRSKIYEKALLLKLSKPLRQVFPQVVVFCAQLYNKGAGGTDRETKRLGTQARSRGLVVKVEGSQSRGCEFES